MSLVTEFHRAFDLEAPPYPTRGDAELIRLRLRLLREECDEASEALLGLLQAKTPYEEVQALQRLLKELADVRYVAEGAAVSFGLDIDGAWCEVHRSNMTKLPEDGRPLIRHDGKIMKPTTYSEADMKKFVPDIIEGEFE